MKHLLTLILSLFIGSMYAQSAPFEMPANYPPTDNKDYIKFKTDFLNAVNWLENTPFNEQKESRVMVNAFVLEYLTNSPDVSVALDACAIRIAEKDAELLPIYMGNYARLAFESAVNKEDQTACITVALKAVIQFYKNNIKKGLIKNYSILQLIEADEKGHLNNWIKDNRGRIRG